MSRISAALLAGLCLAPSPASAGGAAARDTVRVVVKFVKARPGAGPAAIFDPASCPACADLNDPDYARDNARETLVDLRLPRARQLDLAFAAKRGSVTRVIVEATDLPFCWEGERLHVELPPLYDDRIHAGEFATHIVEPGMVLRFEHADPARLAGDYAGKPLPATQRRAVDNLEFAHREAIRRLGLGDDVASQGLGVLELMGFDTNDPHGHRDSPPHFHLHLRWPYNTGTQIGHFHVDAAGLVRTNVVGITAYGLPTRRFGPGESFTTIGNRGVPVYTQTISADGGIDLATAMPDRPVRTCRIRSAGTGFQAGAIVTCDGQAPVTVTATDDLAAGVLRVRTGAVTERFRYDRDTGRLLSPTDMPAVPADAINPESQTTFPPATSMTDRHP